MFGNAKNNEPVEALPGVVRRFLAAGAKTLSVEFAIAAGAVVPAHTHPYEQTGYLVSGRARMRIGSEIKEITSGDAYCIPENEDHAFEALENCIVVDCFAPVRPEYLPG